MKFKALLISSVLLVPLAFVGCGGDDTAGGGTPASAATLSSAASQNTSPSGEFTSTDQLGSAVEGLFNSGGIDAALGAAFNISRVNPNLRNAFSRTRRLPQKSSIFAQGENCIQISETQIILDYGCLGEAYSDSTLTGTITVTFSGDINESFDCVGECYFAIEFSNVNDGQGATAAGIMALWTNGTYDAFYIDGTFGGETFNELIVVTDSVTEHVLGIVITDADGNVLIIDNFSCTPNYENPTECSFDVTDETNTVSCTVTASSETCNF